MVRAAILGSVLIVAGVGSASASECGKPCDYHWWKTATQEEITAELTTVDVNARDKYGETALHSAASRGTPANITVLLKAGADVNTRDKYGETPLHEAAALGTPANIALLLKAGADVNARTEDGYTPLLVAAWRGTSADIIVLLDAGADSRAKDKYGRTPFDRAKKNEKLKGTDAYWALNDAQYD